MKKDKANLKRTSIGGQAVIEGVMMRGKTSMATAVRVESGEILVETSRLKSPEKQNKFLKLPLIRGVVAFVNSLVGGTKTLLRSASVFGDDEPTKFEKWVAEKVKINVTDVVVFLGAFLGIALSLFLFFFLPQTITDLFTFIEKNSIWYFLVEGLIRIAIFISYILLTTLLKDVRRTYMYHGAEHKTISCFESDLPLTVENVKKCSRVHDRCGTTFMFIVMTVSILVFALLNTLLQPLGISGDGILNKLYRFLVKLLSLPIVSGISYEILKFLSKRTHPFFNIFKWPGLLLQRITTKEPDDKMIEVAITAFNKVLEMDADQSIQEVKFNVSGSVKSNLEKAKLTLKKAGITEESEAEWIVSIVLGIKRSELINNKSLVSESDAKKIDTIVSERVKGIPLWYVLGNVDFYGNNFIVNKDVLIPRPETEELVDLVIKENSMGDVLDLCTGSGAIGISLALSEKFNVTASDISQEALEVAKTNAEKLKANVTFIHSNLFENIDKKFDIIVSNPPYLTKLDMQNLQKEVKFEPKLALYGGEDGLDFYRQIIKNAYKYLNEKGVLYLEIGINQYKDIENIVVKEQQYSKVQVIKDIQGVERIVKVNL